MKQENPTKKIFQVIQKYDCLIQRFLGGKTTRKDEQMLLNILLKDLSKILKIRRDIKNKTKGVGMNEM